MKGFKILLMLFWFPCMLHAQEDSANVLEEFFSASDKKALAQWFATWEKQDKPRIKKSSRDRQMQETLKVFKAFYLDDRTGYGGVVEFDANISSHHPSKYTVVQNNLRIAVDSNVFSQMQMDINSFKEIQDFFYQNFLTSRYLQVYTGFYPEINTKKKVIYLDSLHEKKLNEFLGNVPKDEQGNFVQQTPKTEFLKEMMQITAGAGSGMLNYKKYWEYLNPSIEGMLFNGRMDLCYVFYMAGGKEGGIACFKKENKKWTISALYHAKNHSE